MRRLETPHRIQKLINIPNCKSAANFFIEGRNWGGYNGDKAYLTNFRFAKGAKELYQQNVTDMSAVEKAIAETGKFVTNNILFETGKATLKPESMSEIQKVAAYMKKNLSVRFEVQGHTDNQGSDAVNDPLSQPDLAPAEAERAAARVVKQVAAPVD